MTLAEYTSVMMLVFAIVIMWTMCVDAKNKWRELTADVRRNLKPEAPGDA